MKLSNKTLEGLMFGIHHTAQVNGYLVPERFSDEQKESIKAKDYFLYERTFPTSSVGIELDTDATEITFDYWFDVRYSDDSVDFYVNETPYDIHDMRGLPDRGTIVSALPAGKKRVTVYFPMDSRLCLKRFTLNGKYTRVRRKAPKVLWIGDSITQGYGTGWTGQTYVNVANRQLHWDVLNFGIGGYIFHNGVLIPFPDYRPDKIVVALGTNWLGSAGYDEWMRDFFRELDRVYHGIPTLVVTPLWRGVFGDEGTNEATLLDKTAKILKEAAIYPNIKTVDGYTLVPPHVSKYYADDLHPNALGGEIYGNNLVKAIRKLKF